MQIIIHRGTHQIGGCITEITSKKGTRIFIDIGENLPSLEESKPDIQVEGLFSEPRNCSAVFITHYHGDHIGMIERVVPEVPIFMGNIAFKVFELLSNRLKKNITNLKNIITFTAGKQIKIDDIIVTPYRVDHSAYDSYMFLIECEGRRILHTGDFRTHGWVGKGVLKTAKKLIRKVDVIISEGTMLSREKEEVMTERELKEKFKQELKKNDIFVLCSSTNIDTIAGLYNATQEVGKLFVCDDYQREVLDIITNDTNPLKHEIYNFSKAKKYWDGREDTINKMKTMGFCCLIRANGYDTFPKLIEEFKDAKLYYSMWEGYLEKDKPYRIDKVIELVERFNGISKEWHTSGHATFKTIKELCSTLKPNYIIPMHTENQNKFDEIEEVQIKHLDDGEVFEF